MKVPLSWLKEYVDVDATAQELAERLTFSGSEVEGIVMVGHTYEGVVVAEVQGIEPHPGGDDLSICRVSDGGAVRRVVCGAKNFKVGDKVPYARAGTVLPNGRKIETAAIRGEASEGMLCAEDELGISDDHSGLMILDPALKPGAPFSDVVGPPEPVLEIEVTPNRPDCLSIIGMAREVAAFYGRPLKLPSVEFPEAGLPVRKEAKVTIEDAEGCPCYAGRVFSGIRIGSSPLWMKKRLVQCGVRPINNVVDITNYVMLECGQPMHAFDRELIENWHIIVRRAKPGENLATLDGVARAITPEMLVIADAGKPVALAGIMGGVGSEIRQKTSVVLLESACFKPADIRRTSKTLGLSTESSYRYERGVDVGLADWASRRAAVFLTQYAGAQAAKGVIDVFPGRRKEVRITLRFDRACSLIGAEIPEERMTGILESLELKVTAKKKDHCVVRIPTFRVDLEQEADLIEEVARIYGLDRIPTPTPRVQLVPGASDESVRAAMAVRAALVGLGLMEIQNYSFLSERFLDLFDPGDRSRRVILPNPVSADQAVMRTSLIPQMVETLGANRARQTVEAELFEMGRVFFKGEAGELGEEERVAAGLMGTVGRSGLDKSGAVVEQEVFQWLKGLLEALCAALRIGKSGGLAGSAVTLRETSRPYLEDGRAVSVAVGGTECGVMGLVAGAVRKEWRLVDPVGVFELRLPPLLGRVFEAPATRPLSPFPSVARDVALVVEERVKHADVLDVIRKNAPAELVDLRLFDIYRSDNIGGGRKSMAYSFTYRSAERTLTDEEANGFHENLKAALRSALRAEIRDK